MATKNRLQARVEEAVFPCRSVVLDRGLRSEMLVEEVI